MNLRNITFIGNSHITQFMNIRSSYGLNVDHHLKESVDLFDFLYKKIINL